ncbi:ribosome hibernation-promoting factor, HPF/YfiA family [Tindallia californiensis]|uniref:Ribosome hibernation promoting factor n=1 Tax=Tindallia californiensis TaxID=159292 RepID=A0A1H3L9J8_9FIRM|nr:ribosome-associated translation inhibitor RaiA [Tindallia californiensis]SDY60990.1 putative sigma-54 modulation protein [Tindallia californiensis]
MKVIVTGRNFDITNSLRDTIESKLDKLEKYFNKEAEAQVTLSVEKERQIMEVTIPLSGSVLRAEESTKDMYNTVDRVVDKLDSQLRKHKTKLEKNRINNYETIRFENIPAQEKQEEEEARIVKTKRFAVKPMSHEEAVLQMELVGHNFYVYANDETSEVNVVYKRKDGNYGLIEPEFE